LKEKCVTAHLPSHHELSALFRCHQSFCCSATTPSPAQQAATGHRKGAKRDEDFAGGLKQQGTQGAKCMWVHRLTGRKADAATLGMKPPETITKSFVFLVSQWLQ